MNPTRRDRPDGLSRRRFLEQMGRTAAAGSAAGALPGVLSGTAAFAQEENSGPIDCGPPPKAKPTHRTGGESFPPLPLPATPLRRSEKKKPPSPPALIGKMSMGPIRWITREGNLFTAGQC